MKFFLLKISIIISIGLVTVFSAYSQVVLVKYMDYDILTSVKVRGYSFCMQETRTIVFTDTLSFNLINDQFLEFQYTNDTSKIIFPDVRRQIILINSDESYSVLSYDKFSMELNGKSVLFNKKLYELIEEAILRYRKKIE